MEAIREAYGRYARRRVGSRIKCSDCAVPNARGGYDFIAALSRSRLLPVILKRFVAASGSKNGWESVFPPRRYTALIFPFPLFAEFAIS